MVGFSHRTFVWMYAILCYQIGFAIAVLKYVKLKWRFMKKLPSQLDSNDDVIP